MPIYEYRCDDCGRDFEALLRSTTVPACPDCGSAQLTKQLSVFATATASPDVPAMAGGCGHCGEASPSGACPYQ